MFLPLAPGWLVAGFLVADQNCHGWCHCTLRAAYWLKHTSASAQGVVRTVECAGLDPLWAGGIWDFAGKSWRVLTKMETVALTKRRAISSMTDAAERSTKCLWLKGKWVTGTHNSGCEPFSSESLFWLFNFLYSTVNRCNSVSTEGIWNSCYGCKHALPDIVTHTHTHEQHTQSTAEHNPWLGLMNGPSLNYFVKISFRTLKKRSSLFIHFTFAPRLQYLRLCLQRIYPPPIQEEKNQREAEREKSNLHNVHKMMLSEFDNLHKL